MTNTTTSHKTVLANHARMMLGDVDVTVSAELIDPPRAAVMLRANTHNRRPNLPNIDRYAADMAAGRWVFNGATITIDTDGVLADGQNRLYAVIKSGTSQVFLIVTGVEPKIAQATTDGGGKRTVSQHFYLQGVPNSVHMASAIATLVTVMETGEIKSARSPSTLAAQALLEEHGLLADSLSWGRRAYRETKFGAGPATTLHYLFSSINPVDANDFFEKAIGGIGLKEGSPELALHKALIDHKTRPTDRKLSVNILGAMIIKAWNAYRTGRQMKLLSFKVGGKSPEQFPAWDETALWATGQAPWPEIASGASRTWELIHPDA